MYEKNTNVIIEGDCIEILPSIQNNFFSMLFADPPFYVLNEDDILVKNRSNLIRNAEFDHFESYDDFMYFTNKWVSLSVEKLQQDCSAYIFFATQYITDLKNIFESLEFEFQTVISWRKTNPPTKFRKKSYVSSVESLVFFKRGNPTFNWLGQNEMHNYIETPICMGDERIKKKVTKKGESSSLHPTQKPIECLKKPLLVSSMIGDHILDPFTGVGSTNVVSKMYGRFCCGIERDHNYVIAGRRRIEETKQLWTKTIENEINKKRLKSLDDFT